jgi:hypothetical protein
VANVVTFDAFEDEDEIVAYQTGLPRIVLEGKDDVRLFRTYWFAHMIDSFEFVEAADLAEGGGCTAVRQAVLNSRDQNIPAYGFADRDHLFRSKKWELLFTTDDDAFRDGTADDAFYTTLRWEIEAYLLEPDLLPSWLRSHRSPPGSPAMCAAALSYAIDECEHLLGTNPFFAAAHHCKVATRPEHFADKAAHELAAACDKALERMEEGNDAAETVSELVAEALAQAPLGPEERLRWLLRYVDTKRLLSRLSRRFAAQKEIRWPFAELMLQGNRRPRELELRLEGLRNTLLP